MKVRFINCWEQLAENDGSFSPITEKTVLILFMSVSKKAGFRWCDETEVSVRAEHWILTSQTYGWNMFNQFSSSSLGEDGIEADHAQNPAEGAGTETWAACYAWWNFRTWAYLKKDQQQTTWFWYHTRYFPDMPGILRI